MWSDCEHRVRRIYRYRALSHPTPHSTSTPSTPSAPADHIETPRHSRHHPSNNYRTATCSPPTLTLLISNSNAGFDPPPPPLPSLFSANLTRRRLLLRRFLCSKRVSPSTGGSYLAPTIRARASTSNSMSWFFRASDSACEAARRRSRACAACFCLSASRSSSVMFSRRLRSRSNRAMYLACDDSPLLLDSPPEVMASWFWFSFWVRAEAWLFCRLHQF